MNYNNMNMNMNMQGQIQGENMMGYKVNNQMNYNMNMNNQQPQYFITGKFGFRDIAKEDLNTFMANLKSTEWTNNSIYQHAKNVNVTTSLSSNKNIKEPISQRKSNFDSLYLNLSSNLFEFGNYKNEIIERKKKNDEDIDLRKKEFLWRFFPQEMNDPGIDQLLAKISADKGGYISQDSTLKSKLDHVLMYLNQKQPQQPLYQPNVNINPQGGLQQGGYQVGSNSYYNQPSAMPPYMQQGTIYGQQNNQPMYARQPTLNQPGYAQQSTINSQFTNPNPQNMYGNQGFGNPPFGQNINNNYYK